MDEMTEERLAELRAWSDRISGPPWTRSTTGELVDEIDRLRAENERLLNENRAREALLELVTFGPTGELWDRAKTLFAGSQDWSTRRG